MNTKSIYSLPKLKNRKFRKRDRPFTTYGGIYGLVYTQDKKTLYLGSTKNALYLRIEQHTTKLMNGTHHSYRLQEAYRKYGLLGLKAICVHLLDSKITDHDFLLKTIENWYISQFSLSNLTNMKVDYPKFEYLKMIELNMPNTFKRMEEVAQQLHNYQNNSGGCTLSFHAL